MEPAPGAPKRRVMVVADPGRESTGALQWALSHAILEHDEIILLHVEPATTASLRRGVAGAGSNATGGGGGGGGGVTTLSTFLKRSPPPPAVTQIIPLAGGGGGAHHGGDGGGEFLEGMRARCEEAQPKVRVQIERVEMEGKDKAATILSHTRALRVDLLVIGQPRRSSFLGGKLSGGISSKGIDTAEYLIENSKCLCVGVQKKGQKAGYLLNTKTHKNFWLLA